VTLCHVKQHDCLRATEILHVQKHLDETLHINTKILESTRDATPMTTHAHLTGMISTDSDFVDFILPLHERLALYDATSPPDHQPKNDATDPAKAVPQGFVDAMSVRETVFVREQGGLLENELDFDDRRSFTWTAYASVPGHTKSAPEGGHPMRKQSTSTKLAIGTIRLIPPPNTTNHAVDNNRNKDDTLRSGTTIKSSIHDGYEPFLTLGRLAILSEFRKIGVSKLLIDSALTMAHDYPHIISEPPSSSLAEGLRAHLGLNLHMNTDWSGLVLIHAQIELQKFWTQYGFEVDEGMGIWEEEGVDHVAMWKRINLKKASKLTAPYSYTEEPKRFGVSVLG
jgi:predicted GNAT family N-acyltransferase